MDLAEFEALAEPLLRKSVAEQAMYGFALVEGHTVTADEIRSVERGMAVALPDKYKAFMMRYGGGVFGSVELFPVAPVPAGTDDLRTLNDWEFPDRSFVAVAPVGTGDHWGFPVIDGRCSEQVWFHFHDAGDDELVAQDFLEFVANHGLKP
ncbi:SMI1/KNR4 family protein [Actinoplanes sp. NPDC023801]|uniref:SMI1/KNR4 family protein n=1 Tax=Actinoplanes sp. NPDC023801 TaxID=3154595 RepID=UPI003402B91F